MKNGFAEVMHQAQQHRFVVRLEGHECLLTYSLSSRLVDFNHTYVSPALRGRGIAEQLVGAGLSWARQENLTIRASCSYVQKFL